MIDFDTILDYIGGFGRYQILLAIMVCYYSIPSGFNSLAPVFLNYRPDYRCNVPPIDNETIYSNFTESDILNLTTPYDADSEKYDGCYRYGYDLSLCDSGDLQCVNTSADPIKCDMGYHYDTTLFPQTVITEFDLVCDQSYLDPLATSLYMVGILLGSAIFGYLADVWGRKIIMTGCCLLSFAALIGCSFTHNFWLFVTCRVAVSFFGFGCFLASFVYLMEITSKKWRTPIGVSFQIFFAIGYMILSGLAYQWRNWHELNFVTGILGLPYAVFLIFIPESPRWLFSSGKDEKGKEITRKFAKYNRVTLKEPDIWIEAEGAAALKEKESEAKSDARTYSLKDLFVTREIRIITFKIMFSWIVNSFVYYGISLNAGSLAGDIFVNNTLNGVMEIAAYIIVILFMDFIGRRLMMTLMLITSSLGLICSTIVAEYSDNDTGLETLSTVFAFIGKVGISGSYAVIYNFTSEIYPTVVRSNGMGMGSTAARIGSILAPLVIALQNYLTWLPNVIFGVLAAMAALVALTFPETRGLNMMETIEEAEDFYKGITQKTSSTSSRDNSVSEEAYDNKAFDNVNTSKL